MGSYRCLLLYLTTIIVVDEVVHYALRRLHLEDAWSSLKLIDQPFEQIGHICIFTLSRLDGEELFRVGTWEDDIGSRDELVCLASNAYGMAHGLPVDALVGLSKPAARSIILPDSGIDPVRGFDGSGKRHHAIAAIEHLVLGFTLCMHLEGDELVLYKPAVKKPAKLNVVCASVERSSKKAKM